MHETRHRSPFAPSLLPPEDAIRDYAYHLYEQSGRIPGHDLDNWLEAEACLRANMPIHRSRVRLHGFVRGLGPAQQEELCAIPLESHNLGG